MKRTISFFYTDKKSITDYMIFFEELMSTNSFYMISEEDLTHQVISYSELEESTKLLNESISPGNDYSVKKLGDNIVSKLTRVVTYRKMLFRHYTSSAQAEIRISSENDFPAVGADLWITGALSLPAGFITLVGDEEVIIMYLVDTILHFKVS